MRQLQQFQETSDTYRNHGWRLARVLMRPDTLAQLHSHGTASASTEVHFEDVSVQSAEVNAMWFARASHEGREAWELRLVGETPYALFELFEADEADEDREDVRREMEARLREYVGG